MKMKTGEITFRPLRENDLPLLHRWFNTPHVSEWWVVEGEKRPSFELVKKHYLPRINGNEPVDVYLVMHDGNPIGMVQACKLDDEPAEKANFGIEHGCAGIDLLIGEADFVHRGQGSGIIQQFLRDIVFRKYDVASCLVDPQVENEIAIKAYNKAGFKYLKTVWYEKESKQEHILIINRDEIQNTV
jgi:aminoglycoside 6'-N-acetyltransferase